MPPSGGCGRHAGTQTVAHDRGLPLCRSPGLPTDPAGLRLHTGASKILSRRPDRPFARSVSAWTSDDLRFGAIYRLRRRPPRSRRVRSRIIRNAVLGVPRHDRPGQRGDDMMYARTCWEAIVRLHGRNLNRVRLASDTGAHALEDLRWTRCLSICRHHAINRVRMSSRHLTPCRCHGHHPRAVTSTAG